MAFKPKNKTKVDKKIKKVVKEEIIEDEEEEEVEVQESEEEEEAEEPDEEEEIQEEEKEESKNPITSSSRFSISDVPTETRPMILDKEKNQAYDILSSLNWIMNRLEE